jgi:hypothetical protein
VRPFREAKSGNEKEQKEKKKTTEGVVVGWFQTRHERLKGFWCTSTNSIE